MYIVVLSLFSKLALHNSNCFYSMCLVLHNTLCYMNTEKLQQYSSMPPRDEYIIDHLNQYIYKRYINTEIMYGITTVCITTRFIMGLVIINE